jgi:cell wall-associated NlpC family hydrolase
MRSLPLLVFLSALVSGGFAQGAAGSPAKPFLGYLGKATAPVRIYASPSSHSRVFSRAAAYQYLVIKPAPVSGWYAVLLQRGIYGFVPSKSVVQLPYEVRARSYPYRDQYAMSQGDSASRAAVVDYAEQYVGRTPYKWGGTDTASGIDCSAFVRKMYGQIGVDLPRTAYEQSFVGKPVLRYQDLRPGDRLYFWDKKRNMIGHTGIYKGNGVFVHSSHGRGGVEEDNLFTPGWMKILVAARRD